MRITVSEINEKVRNGALDFIKSCEKAYHGEIKDVAREICADEDNKIILLAGPSGSGKTTTAHILCDYLFENGKKTQVISLDDFYLNRADAPRDSEGKPDYETVYSLDIAEIDRVFKEVIKTGIAEMPEFDFHTGTRKEERKRIDISGGGLLIVEGLHALNPVLYDTLPSANLFKIYISVNCDVVYDNGETAIASRTVRFVRRTSRDSIYRSSDAFETFKVWESVVAGEKKYLYGFKQTADRQITTLHPYELCVLKNRVLPMLGRIDESVEDYDFLKSVMVALEQIESVPEDAVPWNSLIREFIPGGKYE